MENELELDYREQETLFIEVILPLALQINYTYRVPFELNQQIEIGKRVIVQFGKNRMYTAIIKSVHNIAPENYTAKYIIDVIDAVPIVPPIQLSFWKWISKYYLCTEGEVMIAALPSALKLASETLVIRHPNFQLSDQVLSEKEQALVNALGSDKKISIEEVSGLLGQKSIYPVITSLLDKQAILLSEELHDKYKPLLKTYIKLEEFFLDIKNQEELFKQLERAPKQLDALLSFLHLSKLNPFVSKQDLLEHSHAGDAAISALIKKEVFKAERRKVSRLRANDIEQFINFELSEAQQTAFDELKKGFQKQDVQLLFGVTASGKTQIYIKLIEEILEEGKQVLFLVPEIALTTQIVERISLFFGDKLGVYHSKFNDNERVEIWNKVSSGEYKIILGARSSIFLPFTNLGLIIVDEEHESSFKQYDPAPRYQARDASIFLASLYKSKVLLGSATPSLESYFNARNGKYGLVELLERFSGTPLPQHQIINLAEASQKKMITAFFAQDLIDKMREVLDKKQQIILFQNRRGYTTILICGTCGFTSKCVQCDVSLTYHKATGKLHCHYCGYHQNILNACPACGSNNLLQKGFGTERIEEELELIFPGITIDRLDLDSTRTKNSMLQIINDFQHKKTDVLIGTQMVAKGLDFDNVALIGVINADTLLNFPDFRAFERSFQLLTQVSGRAGRRDEQGEVIIQAYDAKHRILKQVVENNYEAMYNEELAERKAFNYPPFSRMISIDVKSKDQILLHNAAKHFANQLKKHLGDIVLGPEQPLISRIRSYYIEQLTLKVKREISINTVKEILKNCIKEFQSEKAFRAIKIQIDVDPY